MVEAREALRISTSKLANGTQLVDCGVDSVGGLEAGRLLAECCMADLGTVHFAPAPEAWGPGPMVQVHTDHPLAACMASQYAGWEVKNGDYFAMGSGPMRAAANREDLFEVIGYAEEPDVAVGILETRSVPNVQVATSLADACRVAESGLILMFAPTASHAGNVQIVARSVETAMHKLHELGFDLDRVESGYGTAPLPPVAENDLAGIGRTNDAILYAGQVTLWVRGDDVSLREIGPRIPSNSSSDYGRPFAEIFAGCDHDFYKIDRDLFSPAVVNLVNLDTGSSFRFGEIAIDVIRTSFGPQ
jgi:methenyltetrahydromethanopterin cyclohydrolase